MTRLYELADRSFNCSILRQECGAIVESLSDVYHVPDADRRSIQTTRSFIEALQPRVGDKNDNQKGDDCQQQGRPFLTHLGNRSFLRHR